VDFHHHGLGATTVGDHLLEVISCHGEIRFRTWEYMLPPPKKIFSEHKNSFKKIWHVNLDILCARAKFRRKQTFYVSCIKRQKIARATLSLAPKFVFLHTTQKMSFSRETTL
jgi:hypothetical protein